MQQPEIPTAHDADKTWWHLQTLDENETRQVCIGTLAVYVQRQADEWLVASRALTESGDNLAVRNEPLTELPTDVHANRYVFRRAPSQLRLVPKSLDRPVVVKTDHPVQVPPGESVTFYISAPLCISIDLPELPLTLQEIPTQQLSDTWFGPSTQVGTLCYAARTHARNNRQDVPLRPHRAVTPVTVNNQTSTFLAIKKLSIPVPVLAIYSAKDGTLWTDPVVLTQTQNDALISFAIGKDAPAGELVSAARMPPNKNGLLRAFSSIFAIS